MAGYIGSKSSVTLVDGYTEAEADAEFVNDPNSVITVSGSNVGIGTAAPSFPLSVQSNSSAEGLLILGRSSDDIGEIAFRENDNSTALGELQYRQDHAILRHRVGDLRFATGGTTERMRISASGNVGIGATSPTELLTVGNTSTQYTRMQFYAATNGASTIHFGDGTSGADDYRGYLNYAHDSNSMQFATNGTERMRIDSSGNVLVGKTSAAYNTDGFQIQSNGISGATTSSGRPFFANRKGSDGTIIDLYKDGSTVGSIGNLGNYIYVASLGPSARGIKITDNLIASTTTGANNDNAMDLGGSSVRWQDVYATNGTIQTSDRNEKQDIEALNEAETAVAVACKGLLRKFRWIDAVAEKGDDARIHFGIIAQDLQDAFAAQGLDAGRYAMFISGTWWEADRVIPAVEAVAEVTETTTDEDGNDVVTVITEAVEAVAEQTVTDTFEKIEEAPEGATERTRLGVRYPELLAFIIGAL